MILPLLLYVLIDCVKVIKNNNTHIYIYIEREREREILLCMSASNCDKNICTTPLFERIHIDAALIFVNDHHLHL